MNQIDYKDEDGITLRGVPVVIIADRSSQSTTRGSLTEFWDNDGRVIHATPLIIMEDHRAGSVNQSQVDIVGSRALLDSDSGRTLTNSTDSDFTLSLIAGLGKFSIVQGGSGTVTVTEGTASVSGVVVTSSTRPVIRLYEVSPGVYVAESGAVSPLQSDPATGGLDEQSLAVLAASGFVPGPSSVPPIQTVAPKVTGTPKLGNTLTAAVGTYIGDLPITVSGIWQRNGVDIAGATSTAYTCVGIDVTAVLRWRDHVISPARPDGVDFYSAPTAVVAALPLPTQSAPPAISGQAYVGQTMSYTPGGYTSNGAVSAQTWKLNGVQVSTSSTYAVIAGDVGKSLVVSVTVTNAAGSVTFDSAPVIVTQNEVISVPPPALVSPPYIAGKPYPGQVMSIIGGGATNGATLTAQAWYLDGAQVSTSGTYTIQNADTGKVLTVSATYSSAAGSVSATSAGVTVITQAALKYTLIISDNPGASYTGATDAQVAKAYSDIASNYGGLGEMLVSKWEAQYVSNALLKFSGLSGITGPVVVDSAKLRLLCSYSHQDTGTSNVLSLYSCNKPWVEGQVSWMEFATGSSWDTPGGMSTTDHAATASASTIAPNTTGNWVEWSSPGVASDVQAWINGTATNNGWLLERSDISGLPASYTGDGRKFVTKEGAAGSRPSLHLVLSGVNVSQPKPVIKNSPVVSGIGVVGYTVYLSDGSYENYPTSISYNWSRNGVTIAGATSNSYMIQPADADQAIVGNVIPSNSAGSVTASSASFVALSPPAVPMTTTVNKPMLALPQPARLAGFADPAFGTFIRRITDCVSQFGTTVAKPAYSTIPAWNCDESRLLLWVTHGSTSGFALLNGQTYEFMSILSFPGINDIEHFMWSSTDPNIIFYDYASGAAKELRSRNIVTGAVTTVLVHPASTGQVGFGGDPKYCSYDNDVFGFFDAGSGKAFVRRVSTGDEGPRLSSDLAADVSPTGTYYIVSNGGVAKVYRTSNNTLVRTCASNWYEHGCFVRLSNGQDAWVSAQFDSTATGNGNVIVENIETGAVSTIIGVNAGFGYPPASTHISGIAFSRPGWVAVSIVGNPSATGLLDNELLMVNVNNGTYQRVAHIHTLGNNGSEGYFAEPHANLSPSGTRAMFASDWLGGGAVDTYVCELPPAWTS